MPEWPTIWRPTSGPRYGSQGTGMAAGSRRWWLDPKPAPGFQGAAESGAAAAGMSGFGAAHGLYPLAQALERGDRALSEWTRSSPRLRAFGSALGRALADQRGGLAVSQVRNDFSQFQKAFGDAKRLALAANDNRRTGLERGSKFGLLGVSPFALMLGLIDLANQWLWLGGQAGFQASPGYRVNPGNWTLINTFPPCPEDHSVPPSIVYWPAYETAHMNAIRMDETHPYHKMPPASAPDGRLAVWFNSFAYDPGPGGDIAYPPLAWDAAEVYLPPASGASIQPSIEEAWGPARAATVPGVWSAPEYFPVGPDWNNPYPQRDPLSNPASWPGAYPMPIPLSPPLVPTRFPQNPWRDPREQTERGPVPRPRPRPSPDPLNDPVVVIGMGPGRNPLEDGEPWPDLEPSLSPTGKPQAPTRGKAPPKNLGALGLVKQIAGRAFHGVTEAGDFIDGAYAGVPTQLRLPYRPGQPILPGEKVRQIGKALRSGRYNYGDGAKGLVANAVGDRITGRLQGAPRGTPFRRFSGAAGYNA